MGLRTSPALASTLRRLWGWFWLGGIVGLVVALLGGYVLRIPPPLNVVLFPYLIFAGDVPGPAEGIGGWALEILCLFGSTWVLYGLAGVVVGALVSLRRTKLE